MDSEDEYAPPEGPDDNDNTPNLRRRPAPVDHVFVPRKSPRNSSKSGPNQRPPRRTLPNTLKVLNPRLLHIQKKIRSQPYDSNASLRVIHAALTLQKEHLEAVRKARKGEKIAPPKVRQKVCQLFGVSNKTYQTIISTYLDDNKHIYQTGERGNKFRKETRIPNTKKVVIKVWDCV